MTQPDVNRFHVNRLVQTLDDLVEACEIDLDTWDIDRPRVKSWTGFIKNKEGEMETANMFAVKAELVRKTPIVITPVVQPIKLMRLRRSYRARGRTLRNLRSALLLFDPHFGFRRRPDGYLDPLHDRAALDLALQVAVAEQPDVIVWAGDILDVTEWSDKFVVTPDFYMTTQPAVVEASWWIDAFDRLTRTRQHVVMKGNHDERIDRALNVHLRAAYQLKPADEMALPAPFTLERLLGLKDMDIIVVDDYPDGEFYLNKHARVIHGHVVSGKSGGTVAKIVQQSQVSTFCGHIHRRESAARTVYDRDGSRIIEAHSPGCLCRTDGVVPGRTKRQNWQQGFAMVYFDETGFQYASIPVHDGRALHFGTSYIARDQRQALRTSVNWDSLFGAHSLGLQP